MQTDAHPEGIIHLDVAATDREGKPFSGLAAKDFTLTDNGVPKKIVSFAASNQPTNEMSDLLKWCWFSMRSTFRPCSWNL